MDRSDPESISLPGAVGELLAQPQQLTFASARLLERYEDPFHKPDRETEMRAAYDELTRRLEASG